MAGQLNMEELVLKLNEAADAYYNGSEIMDNYEYDRLYDELFEMEQKSGVILPNSPTQRAGFRVVDNLPKVTHEYPTLSLDKTKDQSLFSPLFNVRDRKAVVMWKMDGSTIVANYADGKLMNAVTRGNGFVGSDITHNAPYIKGLPQTISYSGRLCVRGEAVMSYPEFERINTLLPVEEQYKNPRNLANATISLLSSKEMSRREIFFCAFRLVALEESEQYPGERSFEHDMEFLKMLGIHTVEYEVGYAGGERIEGVRSIDDVMDGFSDRAESFEFPVDGLVAAANDVLYAEAQPGTAHNPNKLVGYALKWKDETAQTVLRDIEWQASRTGLLNPVAVFDPVELEGTTCTKATLHNISYIVDLDLKPGDTILVYKANKIIPKVASNLNKARETSEIGDDIFQRHHIPEKCPVCGGAVSIEDESGSGSYAALCRDLKCPAKMIGKFIYFCMRDSMNIIGLSEATVEKFVDSGFIHTFADFWKLDRYRNEIEEMEGFGRKSFEKIAKELELARHTVLARVIGALGIPNIGIGQSKLIVRHYMEVLESGSDAVEAWIRDLRDAEYSFSEIEGFGAVLDRSLHDWANDKLDTDFIPLLEVLDITDRIVPEKEVKEASPIEGKTFVITGDVHIFANRKELQTKIEELGGKAAGSVSKKTDYLINNDFASASSKNQKAKTLGVPIITEEQFMEMINA